MLDRKAKSLKHEQSWMVLKIIVEPILFIHSQNKTLWTYYVFFNNSF